MIEHLKTIQCQCGNTFEIFGNEQYKCPCEKTWITNNDYWVSYRNTDGYGNNFETISSEEYISDDSGLIDPKVIALYELCKDKAATIGFSWYESTTKNRKSNQKIVTYINAEYDISLKNNIENNIIEFYIKLTSNNHDEYLKRFNNFLIVLNELEKGELDFSDRTRIKDNHKNAFQKIEDKHKDFDFDATEEKLDYSDIRFHI